MSLRDELLAPFRGWREAGRDLAAGSRVLARHTGRGLRTALRTLWRASSKGQTRHDRADSIGTAALAGVIAAAVVGTVAGPLMRLARPYLPLIGGVAPVLWMVAALVAAPRAEAHPTTNDHEESAGEKSQEADETPDPEAEHEQRIAAIRQRVEHLVAAAVQAGAKGARTADILTAFQTGGHLPDWDDTRLRALLRTVGIPVRDQMYFKINGKKANHPGVHVDDLTATLGHAPHLVPDLTPTQRPTPTLSLVKDDPQRDGRAGAA